MQQQKEKLTAELNDTVAEHLALEEEDTRLKLALGNITSSLHQQDVRTSSGMERIHFNPTHPLNYTTEVSLDSQKHMSDLFFIYFYFFIKTVTISAFTFFICKRIFIWLNLFILCDVTIIHAFSLPIFPCHKAQHIRSEAERPAQSQLVVGCSFAQTCDFHSPQNTHTQCKTPEPAPASVSSCHSMNLPRWGSPLHLFICRLATKLSRTERHNVRQSPLCTMCVPSPSMSFMCLWESHGWKYVLTAPFNCSSKLFMLLALTLEQLEQTESNAVRALWRFTKKGQKIFTLTILYVKLAKIPDRLFLSERVKYILKHCVSP